MNANHSSHPEKIPNVKQIHSLVIDLDNFEDSVGDIEKEWDAIEMRISKYDRECRIGDFNVLRRLIEMSEDPKEIRKLGRALEKISEYLERREELQKLMAFVALARQKPNVLVSALGDFSSSFGDTIDDSLFEEFD